MKQYAVYAVTLALTLAGGAGVANAQTAAAAPDRGYIEMTGGPTFGHKMGGSIGAEGAWYLTPMLGVFAEAGWMSNVTTSDIENHAQQIAAAIGGSLSPKTKATYFDVGGTFQIPMEGHRAKPYVLVGVGVAHVTTDTTLNGGGLAVQFGTDLAGSYNKPFVMVGGGVHIPFGARWLGDISYRYGWIGKNTSDNNDISAVNTNRLQFGFGARF